MPLLIQPVGNAPIAPYWPLFGDAARGLEHMTRFPQYSYCFKSMPDDKPLMLLGIVIEGGRGHCWVVTAPDIPSRLKVLCVRSIIQLLNGFLLVTDVHRLEARTHPADLRTRRLLHKLGFVYEGTNTHFYVGGEDAFMYGKVPPW